MKSYKIAVIAGDGGALAWSQTNTFPGDGYTWMSTNLPHIVLQPLEGQVQYKTEDISNVCFYHYTPDAIVVRGESPYKSYQELVKAAKDMPGAVTIAGSGTNSANHLATEKRHPQFPDAPTFKELGIDWVDGAYRGIALPKSASPEMRKQVSDICLDINKDADFQKRMADGGFELVDIGVDKMPAFMAERAKVYIEAAKRMGLVK